MFTVCTGCTVYCVWCLYCLYWLYYLLSVVSVLFVPAVLFTVSGVFTVCTVCTVEGGEGSRRGVGREDPHQWAVFRRPSEVCRARTRIGSAASHLSKRGCTTPLPDGEWMAPSSGIMLELVSYDLTPHPRSLRTNFQRPPDLHVFGWHCYCFTFWSPEHQSEPQWCFDPPSNLVDPALELSNQRDFNES